MQRWHTPTQAADWLRANVQGQLQTDSRRVRTGDGFIAWPGGVTDARRFVPDVLQQGAKACLVEDEQLAQHAWASEPAAEADPRVARYAGLKAACGPIAAAYYEQPSARMDVLAITGTNGKTSTAWWLAHALQALGRRCAMVGTLGVGEPQSLQTTGMTTPDPVLLQAHLRQWADAGVQACAMEASSIGLAEHRLDGTHIRVAVFTNFTQDHLDYHGSMAAYWQAKAALFDWPGLHTAVVNVDDPQGAGLAEALRHCAPLTLWTFARESTGPAKPQVQHHLQAQAIAQGPQGLQFDVCEGGQRVHLQTRLIGLYNVSNLLGVMTVLRAMGHALSDAARVCADLPAVPGRMQMVKLTTADATAAHPCVVVDYAHTPDAVAQALLALRPLAQTRGGALTCVLGCGGDRDPHKRPWMASAAAQHAERVMLTSDNPRSEDPQRILADMRAGLSDTNNVATQVDRAQAIAQAIAQAQAQDVVLIAGKGHEDYQEVAGVRHPFSDVTHAQAALQQWGAHG